MFHAENAEPNRHAESAESAEFAEGVESIYFNILHKKMIFIDYYNII